MPEIYGGVSRMLILFPFLLPEALLLTYEEKQADSSWSCPCALLLCSAGGWLPGFNLILKNKVGFCLESFEKGISYLQ